MADSTLNGPVGVYQPTPAEAELIADSRKKRDDWRIDRQPHEQDWFLQTAFYRGNHYAEWNDKAQRIAVPKAPPHRIRLKINRLQAKVRARLSKFLKNRPKPVVVPATTEYEDYLNARATQKVLDYLWRKARLEQKFRDAILWAMMCGKSFWWYHWNPSALARVKKTDPLTGQVTYEDQPLGDLEVEVGSAFEILVKDPGIAKLADQPEIMRVKMRYLEDVKARYPDYADFFSASTAEESLFTYERQIAGLNPVSFSTNRKENKSQVLVTEHFIRPNAKYPAGHYRVVVGDVLVKNEDSLPLGFFDLPCPYPATEFVDIPVPGQFWGTTVCSQLIDLQREYNLMRSKLAEHLRLMAFPKLLVAKQHQVPKSQWTSEPGEIIEYVAVPQVPPPTPFVPPPIAGDLWRNIDLIKTEFDDVPQIFPSAEGKTAGATSGFQTNLLQEATDSVHAPDIRQAELSIEEAAVKMRRIVKLGYTVPRIISTVGSDYQPEIFEFVSDQVDEMADLVVEVGSALPTMKAAKQDAVMNLYKAGLLGDPADPEVRRRALGLLEMGAVDEAFDVAKVDENQAELENEGFKTGQPVPPPHFWENHRVHYDIHTALLKSPVLKTLDPSFARQILIHVLLHARFINPQSALKNAMEEQIPEVIPVIQQMLMPMGPPPGAPGAPPPPGGGPPGPPPGAPPPPSPDQAPPQ